MSWTFKVTLKMNGDIATLTVTHLTDGALQCVMFCAVHGAKMRPPKCVAFSACKVLGAKNEVEKRTERETGKEVPTSPHSSYSFLSVPDPVRACGGGWLSSGFL